MPLSRRSLLKRLLGGAALTGGVVGGEHLLGPAPSVAAPQPQPVPAPEPETTAATTEPFNLFAEAPAEAESTYFYVGLLDPYGQEVGIPRQRARFTANPSGSLRNEEFIDFHGFNTVTTVVGAILAKTETGAVDRIVQFDRRLPRRYKQATHYPSHSAKDYSTPIPSTLYYIRGTTMRRTTTTTTKRIAGSSR